MEMLQDDQFYFFRLKPTGVGRDWRIGHLMIEDGEMKMHTIGYAGPLKMQKADLAAYDFVRIERPATNK